MQVSDSARDLGITTSAGKRRVSLLQNKRLVRMRKRAHRVGQMARRDSSASKLVPTGIYPMGLWGHTAHGATPTMVKHTRTVSAQCSGHYKSNCCVTSLIAVVYGSNTDPYLSSVLNSCVIGFTYAGRSPSGSLVLLALGMKPLFSFPPPKEATAGDL